MRILVANTLYPPIMAGGAELIVAYLAEGLAARGHEVCVVSTCGPEMEPHPVERRNGVEVIRFFPPNVYWSFARAGQGRLAKLRWHLKDAWNRDAGRRLGTIMTQRRPDLLHTHLIDGFSAAIWRAARLRGMKVLHTAHDYHLLCPRAFLLTRDWKICTDPTLPCRAYRSWHLRTTGDVDLFASPSRFLLDRHLAAGLRSRASVVAANGIPLPAVVSRPPRPDGAPVRFLLLARLTVEKGIRVALDAMARIPPDIAVRLTIAGRGILEPEVAQAAARDPRIDFAGYVQGEGKQALLLACDHMLVPSLWYENANVVILEAAAYGLGLIGSRIGGMPEFVREGRTGWLVAPGDAAALAGQMMEAAGDAAFAAALPAHASALVAEFTVARMVDTYLGHYDRLLHA